MADDVSLLGLKENYVASQALFCIVLFFWAVIRMLLTITSCASMLKGFITLDALRFACYLALAIRELVFCKWNRSTFLGMGIFAVLFACALPSNWSILADGAAFIFAARGVSFKKAALTSGAALAAVLIITISLSFAGAIPSNTLGRGEITRMLLGFNHPNTGPALWLFLLCTILYLRNGGIGVVGTCLALGITFAFFYFTNCRTAVLSSLFVLAASPLFKRLSGRPPGSIVTRVLLSSCVLIIAAISIVLALAYSPEYSILSSINGALSGRLALAHGALAEYGIAPFGQNPSYSYPHFDLQTNAWVASSAGYWVDCVYIRLPIQWGIVPFALSMILIFCLLMQIVEKGNWVLYCIILCIAVFGISEVTCAYLMYNPFLLLLGSLFNADPTATAKWRNGKHAKQAEGTSGTRSL